MEKPFLRDQCAIISGGLGDIGRAIAHELAAAGADIAVGDLLSPDAADHLRKEVEAMGRRFHYCQVDIADSKAVSEWLGKVEQELGVPTLVIPNAAIVTIKPYPSLTPEEWRRELDVNLNGAFYLAQFATRRLVELAKPGRVVFIGSWAGHAPHRHLPAYSVAKAGLRMLCKTMAVELAEHGILVNEVAPGYVDAGLSGRSFQASSQGRERAMMRVPIKALIRSEEVARQVLFLCGPDATHYTGSVLLMDGGLSLL